MRVQKCDPIAAFAGEVAAHKAWFDRGMQVAPILASDADFLVTQDCGPTLNARAKTQPEQPFHQARASAATALAEIHQAGLAHGRPSLKDICWKDGNIAFLDFERAGREGNVTRAQTMDVLILIFSTAVETGNSEPAMKIARDTYRAADGNEIWTKAQARARRWSLLQFPLWPIARMLRGNSEFDAIAPFFRFIKD